MKNIRLESLSFAGYRSFAARSPVAPDRKLESMRLAPVTVLLGKNNSGKSTAAKFIHHALLALGSEGKSPLPMAGGKATYGTIFRDVQHGGNFFNPLDISVHLVSDDNEKLEYDAQLIQLGDLNYDAPPSMNSCAVNGKALDLDEVVFDGLLPASPEFDEWRRCSKRLLDLSCHIPPIRDAIKRSYELAPISAIFDVPTSNHVVAQMLAHNSSLRSSVGLWMEQNLDGWRLDSSQVLDAFQLQVKRSGREVNLADAGQGIQQVLPVIALCHWRQQQTVQEPFVDIVEQPELHLHDAAHAALGDLLYSAVAGQPGNIVIETHSEAIVLRLRRRIAEGLIEPHEVAIYYVEDTGEGSKIIPINVDSTGEVEWWPEGVFSESFVEVKAIRAAQREQEQS